MQYKFRITRVEQAERWIRATDEEAAIAKLRAELAQPYGLFGEWRTVDTQLVVIASKQQDDARQTWAAPDAALLLSISEAAEALGVPVTTMRKIVANDEIPSREIGRRRFIYREDLKRYAEGG